MLPYNIRPRHEDFYPLVTTDAASKSPLIDLHRWNDYCNYNGSENMGEVHSICPKVRAIIAIIAALCSFSSPANCYLE
jgi:hypothetical protein